MFIAHVSNDITHTTKIRINFSRLSLKLKEGIWGNVLSDVCYIRRRCNRTGMLPSYLLQKRNKNPFGWWFQNTAFDTILLNWPLCISTRLLWRRRRRRRRSVLRPYIMSPFEKANKQISMKQRPINTNSTVTDKFDCGSAVTRGCLHCPSWGISSLRAGKIHESRYPEDGGDMCIRIVRSYYNHTM
jgi:hypothetical protein